MTQSWVDGVFSTQPGRLAKQSALQLSGPCHKYKASTNVLLVVYRVAVKELKLGYYNGYIWGILGLCWDNGK